MSLFQSLGSLIGRRGGKLQEAWELPLKEPIMAPPAIGDLHNSDRSIVFGTKIGNIYSIDEKGSIGWLFSPKQKKDAVSEFFLDDSSKSIICTPIIADINNDKKNEVIVGSESGILYTLDCKGKLISSYECQGAIRSVICHDINKDGIPEILFGSKDGFFYAMSGKKLLWKFKADSAIEACPAVLESKEGVQIIFGSNDGDIYSLDMAGRPLWRLKADGKITAAPVIGKLYESEEDYAVIGSHDSCLYAINSKGKLKWKYLSEGSIFSKAIIADVNKDGKMEVAFGSCDDNIYLISHEGDIIWKYETDFWVVSSPIVVDIDGDSKPEIVAGSYDKSLYILDPEGALDIKYMPGISGITGQTGSYNDAFHSAPAQICGKLIWKFKAKGIIIGAALLDESKSIIIATENSLNKLHINKDG